MLISVLTLFPEMFEGPFSASIIKRAQANNLLKINLINIRQFATDKYKTVDDTPYGGGKGMVMRVDIVVKALESLDFGHKVLLTPQGKTFNHRTALNLSKKDHLIFICGHYEGIDNRIQYFVDEEISIGDYVLTGGELPAMVIIDSVARHIPDVLSKETVSQESFAENLLEYPQYTKPEDFRGYRVPPILLSGHHQDIAKWRSEQAYKNTLNKRKDLLKKN